MPEASKTIQLTIPALDSRKNPETIVRLNDLKSWVDDLPYANPHGMMQEVLSSLKLLNRHPARLPLRPNLMMLYMEPFLGIIELARKIRCQDRNSHGPNKKERELLAMASAICTEMAYGFKHIVVDEIRSAIKIAPDQCSLYIHLAMLCLSKGLLLDMTAYQPESRTAWREIYQLFIRAQQLGIAHQEITNAVPKAGYEVSILNTFKCILLTSILDASRLTPSEIWGTYDYLCWYAKNARITSIEQAAPHSGNYLIPRDGTEKPTLFDADNPPSNPGKYMVLETHRLNIVISRHLDIILDSSSSPIRGCEKLTPDTKRHILKQMLHIWHNNPKRRHERKEKFDRISCAFGVGSAYHFLKEGTMRIPYMESEHEGTESNQNMPGPELTDILMTYECRQENISASGMMILSSDQSIAKLRIGQMVVTESMIGEKPLPLKVGIVRRITQRDQNTMEFGIQFLPGKLRAATALPEIFGRQHAADMQPCVVLELSEDKPKALITPHLIYQASRNYIIDVKDIGTNRVIAGKLLESTNCYDCFEYNVLEHC